MFFKLNFFFVSIPNFLILSQLIFSHKGKKQKEEKKREEKA